MAKKIKPQNDIISMKKPEDKYPVFCFKYLQPYSYPESTKVKFFIDFLQRLQKLGELGWNEINKAQKHGYGTEKIPLKQLKPKVFPSIITEEVKELTVFRATGNNLPFLGIRLVDTFHVIFIESNFNDIYTH